MTAKVPKPVRNVDIMSLPLSTKEGFVLSRVDGSSSVEDISMMSGVPHAQLLVILDRLAELGAVTLSWKAPVAAPKPAPGAPRPTMGSAAKAPTPVAPQAPAQPVRPVLPLGPAARYDAKLLDEPVEISREIRKRILDYYFTLETHNYYQILGISVRADKKEVRAAYFELSKFFHPDSQFTKKLGSYKARMEAVFKRLTEAYEVLSKPKRRAEYDEYIAVAVQTERVSQSLDEGARRAQTLRNIEVQQPRTINVTSRPAPPVVATRPASPPPAAPISAPRRETSLRPPPSQEDRKVAARDRLARRLGADGKSVPPPPAAPKSSRPPPPLSPEERRVSVIKDLARSIKGAADVTGPPSRIQQHLDASRSAERSGDWLGAANALQLALALEPERQDLLAEYTRVSAAVARSLADNYEKQARYEEKFGKWDAAARSWSRVCEGRPEDAVAACHAAEALLKSGGDLHRAQRYAQRAVELVPEALQNLTLLARVYLAAGLKLNARRELEKAVKLDPTDEMVKNLLNEAR
jgi:curved DNA-binding protein CbpA